MKIQGAKNLDFLLTEFDYQKSDTQIKQGFVFEGGSGSAKTQDIIRFIMLYCQHYKNKNKDILIFRQTLSDLKKSAYKDFMKVLRLYGLYDENRDFKSQPMHYDLFGNTIYFSGLDSEGAHGERHDLIWANEAMEIDREGFKQLNQRCNEAFILDYNPNFTDHWIFNEVITRDDTKFCVSTQLDNPFLPEGQRREIISYEPTEDNIRQGTADDYMWNVYGLGIRSAPEGLIYQHVTWIDKFPDNLERIYWGLDFGYTDHPSALVKVGVQGKEMYLHCLFYSPTESPMELIDPLDKYCGRDATIWADPSGRGMIAILRREGFGRVLATNTYPGSVEVGIAIMKGFKIHIVSEPAFRKEQANYKYRTVNGKPTNDPIKLYDDAWDAARMVAISNLSGG